MLEHLKFNLNSAKMFEYLINIPALYGGLFSLSVGFGHKCCFLV